jgi:L-ascorbate metabolism protein UlaG (beta-lactamase superfamily)
MSGKLAFWGIHNKRRLCMVKVNYFGHDCFLLEGSKKSVLVDPFFKGNPMGTTEPSEMKPALILVTHGHGDHLGDAIEISKDSGAPVLATFELANYCEKHGAHAIGAHMGGTVRFDFGWVKLVPAWHSSSDPQGNYLGAPCGFVIHLDGVTFYHTGDTCLFSDMKLIAEMTPIDVFFCPIGDHYTMGPAEALKAVEFVHPRLVIPMHYNTFPPITQDPALFREAVEKKMSDVKVKVLAPGATTEIEANGAVKR